MGTIKEQNLPRLNGTNLKMIACLSMLADHFSAVFGFSGSADLILRQLIGRLAFPIFAFLLVEGFLHTRNIRKYFTGLFLFAVLSEIPYDLALKGTAHLLPEFTGQNTLFTLSLGLLMLQSMKKTESMLFGKDSANEVIYVTRLLVILFFGAVSRLLHLDYGFTGMACIGAMYIFRSMPANSALWGCVCLNLDFFSMPGAFLSLVPISCYDGSRGKQKKYFFYLFYPLHLLVLFFLRKLFF